MTSDQQASIFANEYSQAELSRRSLLKRAAVLGLSTPVIAGLLAACGSDDDDGEDNGGSQPTSPASSATATTETVTDATVGVEPTQSSQEEQDQSAGDGRRGGRLRVALIGEPPTLDIHQESSAIGAYVVYHMYETLFTWDSTFAVIPLLAESFEVSDDGLVNSIKLREGVLFHNGEEMKAADVIASFRRWAERSGPGMSVKEATSEVVEMDDYNIEFKMNKPLGSFAELLSRLVQGLAIFPKSIVDAAGDDLLTEFIGTGPYQLTEQQADRYILLSRFEDYVGLAGEPNGYGGAKAAYVDEIEFVPVPDEAARIAGLQAGDYHILQTIIPDQAEVLRDDPNVAVDTLPASTYQVAVLNLAQGVMTDLKIRQAFQAVLDCEPIMQAAQGEGYYRLDPGFMIQETVWHSTASAELYNQGNPEKARQLLEEAGYDGTPLRWLTTQEYLYDYNAAVVAKQQLEAVGFTIELVVTDRATLDDTRRLEDQWEVFSTGFSFQPDPVGRPIVAGCSWPGWWCTDEKVAVVERLQSESDFDIRYAAMEELQTLWYTDIPGIKFGDTLPIVARSPKLRGLDSTLFQLQPEFVNVWLED